MNKPILTPAAYAEVRRKVRDAMGLPIRLTPWERRQAFEEGRRWSEEFSKTIRAMETLTPEDWATRCR